MASKRYAEVDQAVCVACGTCVAVCPKEVTGIPDGCWAVINSEVCVGCGLCAKACPAGCIALVERTDGR